MPNKCRLPPEDAKAFRTWVHRVEEQAQEHEPTLLRVLNTYHTGLMTRCFGMDIFEDETLTEIVVERRKETL